MRQDSGEDARLFRYLLGEMAPEEQAHVEERYLADPEFHDELLAAERDLIDRYVHGELADREAFEKTFLSSPSRRRKVEFARALMRSSALAPVAAGRTLPLPELPPYRAWQLAAGVFAVLVAGWLIDRSGRGVAPPERARPPQDADLRSPSAPPGPVIGPPSPAATARFALLALSPTSTRSAEETPTLTIRDEGKVHLELQLEVGGGYASYRGELRTPEGEEVWREERLTPRRSASGESVVMKVPASRLVSQDYVVRLGGVTPREVEELGSYSFRVRVTRPPGR